MEQEPPDTTLVKQAQSGCDEAFRELVSRYKNYVFALIGRQVSDREIAEDLSQDVFIKVYKALPKYRGEASFKSWITRIALNTSHSYFQSKRFSQKARNVQFEEQLVDSEGQRDHDPVQQKYLKATFRLCFGKMAASMQEVIVLCGFQELSYQEVAHTIDIPIGTVRSRLNRARLTLKECMEQQGALR